MGAPEQPCSATGVVAGRAEAWGQLDVELREAGCLAPASGRCASDQWEAYCREGECSAHSTSGY